MIRQRTNNRGLTLIELLIVLAILSILSAIAIPIYRGYLSSAKRSEAKTNLQQLKLLLDRYYSENGKYCPEQSAANCPNKKYVYDASAGTDQITNWLPGFKPKAASSSDNPLYKYTIIVGANDTYTITATPQKGAPKGTLSINQDGEKTGW